MKSLIRQLFVALLGGVVAAGVMLAVGNFNRSPGIALAQTSVSITGITATDADAAKTISYQGQVFDPSTGAPIANTGMNFSFRISQNGDGSSQVYQEDKNIISNADGFFNTRIGDIQKFEGNFDLFRIFNGQQLYLGVYINNEQLSPYQPITFVPYAFWADHAHHFDSYGVDDFPKIVAFGVVDGNGNKSSGKAFASSRQSVGGTDTYVISLDNADFDINNYTAIITPACFGNPAYADVGKTGNDMIVDIFDENGNHRLCTFQFMVLKR